MLSSPARADLEEGFAALAQRITALTEAAYGTTLSDGARGEISHTFRVAVAACTHCDVRSRMFPHALVSLCARAERGESAAFLACARGHLFRGLRDGTQGCPQCQLTVEPSANYTGRRIIRCWSCGKDDRLSERAEQSSYRWEPVLVERSSGRRREIDLPRPAEVQQAEDVRWKPVRDLGEIPDGQETAVLLRHGFRRWQDLYPRRQQILTEQLLDEVQYVASDDRVGDALRLAIIGTTEMAGLLSRWDRFYLKSFESMANHRFNFTTFAAEPNVWGTRASGRGTVLRRVARMLSASDWWSSRVGTPISAAFQDVTQSSSTGSWESPVTVAWGSSERQTLPDGSCDLVLTDPPYHDDVQYEELSLPLRAWAGLPTTAVFGDVAVNPRIAREEPQADLLARIFRECRRTLRADGHLIFSFANRDPRAWIELLGALHNAGYRTAGTEIIHSENESDAAKRNVRACTLDLILDLVPRGSRPVLQHYPGANDGDEASFLSLVSGYVRQVGELPDGWAEKMRTELSEHPFLRPTASRA